MEKALDNLTPNQKSQLTRSTIKVILKSGRLTKATPDSACFDVHASQDVLLVPGEVVTVPTGIRSEMTGCSALLLDRSGLAAKFGVTRRAGVIDADYRGEWLVVMVNEGKEGYQIKAGDRIAQCLFVPHFDVLMDGNVEIKGVERAGGFGSSGV